MHFEMMVALFLALFRAFYAVKKSSEEALNIVCCISCVSRPYFVIALFFTDAYCLFFETLI